MAQEIQPLSLHIPEKSSSNSATSTTPASADSLISDIFDICVNVEHLPTLKRMFRASGITPQDLALSYSRLGNCTSDGIQSFLITVSDHGREEENRTRAAETLIAFTQLDSVIPAVSGYKWTGTELQHLYVEFDVGYSVSHIATEIELSAAANEFVNENKFITVEFYDTISTTVYTKFSDLILHALTRPSEESSIDDVMSELFRSIFVGQQFLVKTRSVLPLEFNLEDQQTRKRKRMTEATADVILYLRLPTGKFQLGVCAVEDKSYMYMDSNSKTANPAKAAEAQMFAEGIAIAQQPGWNIAHPIYLLRVMGLSVTFYRVHFTQDFLNAVRTGTRRTTPLKVAKFVPSGPAFESGDVGFDLRRPDHRNIIARTLNSIALTLTCRAQSVV